MSVLRGHSGLPSAPAPVPAPAAEGRPAEGRPAAEIIGAYAATCLWELGADHVELELRADGRRVLFTFRESDGGSGGGSGGSGGPGLPPGPAGPRPVTIGCPVAATAPASARALVSACRLRLSWSDDGTVEHRLVPAPGARVEAGLARLRLADRLARPGEGIPGRREREALTTAPWAGGGEPVRWPDLCDAFTAQARATPGLVAVTDDTEELTYAELDRWTGSLALRLRAEGVGTGEIVAVGVERGVASVAAVLGVLRAGAAYLPVGVDLPLSRQRRFLAVSGARVAVVGDGSPLRNLVERPIDVASAREEAVASAREETTAPARNDDAAVTRLPSPPGPETLAYVLFTSGSTGEPKAVAMPRRSLNHHVDWYRHHSSSPVGGRSLHFADLGWDTSTAEIFPTLCSGGTVVVAGRRARRDPDRLVDLLRTSGVQRMVLPPQVLAQIAERCLRSGGPALPLLDVVSGGEQLVLTDVLRRWLLGLPGAVLQNHYGPSETQLVTAYVSDPAQAPDLPPIGRPCGNNRLYVLDETGRPAAVGEPGELVIAGPGVASGYLGDPAATAAAFVPDPSGASDGRAYRSGDLVRRLPDGNLQFVGRVDRQVKVRGYRVEPAEVERVLTELPRVRAAAVTAVERAGHRSLVAFVVTDADTADLLGELERRLPGYMVPSRIEPVDALPLTPNGKVDVSALLDHGTDAAADEPVARPVAAVIAAWTEVLGAAPGPDTDFRAAGGDSLTAMTIAARCHVRGLRVSAVDVLEAATPRRLADIAGRAGGGVTRDLPGAGTLLPLLPSQADALRTPTPDRDHWYQAALFRTGADLDTGLLREAVRAVVAAHPSLRCAVTDDGQRVVEPYEAVADARSDTASGGLAAALARVRGGGLDLGSGRLVDVTRLSGDRLLLVVHQMAFDAVSWGTFTSDLQEAYRTLRLGGVPALGEATSTAAWLEALRGYAAGVARDELPVWRDQVRGEPALPPDVPGGSRAVNLGGTACGLERALDADSTRRLLRETPLTASCRADEVVLHALVRTLAAGRTGPVRLDTLQHGRAERIAPGLDLSRTTGWFTTVAPLTVALPRSGGPRDELAATVAANRSRPLSGVGFGALRHFGTGAPREALNGIGPADVSFDFLGTAASLYPGELLVEKLDAALGPYVHDGWERPHPVEVQAYISEGRLVIGWTYSKALHSERLIRRTADRHIADLVAMVDGRAWTAAS